MYARIPPGYEETDAEQHRVDAVVSSKETDPRSVFMHDLDRILYCPAFNALAGKTQVVASIEIGGFHTRLTHTLKVAQLGRRIAEFLRPSNEPGPDPDLVEACCLAHDIGHPPFGHAGEVALSEKYAALSKSASGSQKDEPSSLDADGPPDGFEGNAQNLRILTFLTARKELTLRGLHLTRATLDGTMKYPWVRSAKDVDRYRSRKFGVYKEDVEVLRWIGARPEEDRPVEEQIMDWADEVTYACHDVEDFFRANLIPLDLIFDVKGDRKHRGGSYVESYDLARFLDYLSAKRSSNGRPFDRAVCVETFAEIGNLAMLPGPYYGLFEDKVLVTGMTTRLINYFLTDLKLVRVKDGAGLVRGRAKLIVPERKRLACSLLKELIFYFVIDRPELASQQHGQSRIVSELLQWHTEDPERLLPPDRIEEVEIVGNPLRTACDYVASLTEPQAMALYHRMTGISSGSITDRIR